MSKKPLLPGQMLYRLCGVFLAMVVIYGIIVNVKGVALSSPNPCLMNEKMHLYCPGCGGTRAFHAMLTGHLILSLEYNAFVVPTFAFILYYFIGTTLAVRNGGTKIYFRFRKWMIAVLIIIILWVSVGRNFALVCFQYDPIGDLIKYHSSVKYN